MVVRRGDVHWVDPNPFVGSEQGGQRPVVVVQGDPVNRHASTAIVVAITSRAQVAGFPLTVHLPTGEAGLPRPS